MTIQKFLIFFTVLMALTGCASAQADELPYIDLTNREPLPSIADTQIVPLRVAVAAIISPQGTVESYSDLGQYLSKKLNRPVELVQRRTYAEVNELVAQDAVDLAFVCTSAYVVGSDSHTMDLLVAPEVNHQQIYHSMLIVPANSPAQSIADLQGKVFAFTDPISFSGRAYPTYLVVQQGIQPETFFSQTLFTHSHDKAIEAVAQGIADGAAVDSLVLKYALERDPSLAEQIKVIDESPPFGIPPVVVPSNISPQLKAKLREILLDMTNDADGRAILAKFGFDRFSSIDDNAYDSAREIISVTGIGVQ